MSFGSSKPKKAEPTALEKEQSAQGIQKWNRYISQYAPLEEQALQESGSATVDGLLGGRSNADVFQKASQQSQKALTGSTGISSSLTALSDLSRLTGQGAASGVSSAQTDGREYQDTAQLGMIKTGLGQQQSNTSTLSSLAQISNQQALAKASAENAVGSLSSQLLTAGAGTALGQGAAKYARNKRRDEYNSLLNGGIYNNVRTS